jgi:hypothetical protein
MHKIGNVIEVSVLSHGHHEDVTQQNTTHCEERVNRKIKASHNTVFPPPDLQQEN